ncbi:LacI family DNA-binding transcriptional regulator [Conexibacter woesei]|uniref:Transcriptional regulator, LacI family n=1 Tax=Conexibacter woesei (strain DSM 14684 / CCUG 47730 / CIP 108061 / JCM 11494 / NBRC 100937 / ID131577) TaxID=469383 RepID=D3F7W6_CONWI|nr:LacI family DNA-binding transcriptional regulator [Conexibacter woesei]ADB52860.1 transcriptional regulator, LacI family [Conexibacter woesei DSM 14684]
MPTHSNAGRQRPTLRHVAAEADVSIQTVSNVLRRRFDLMRPETRERVEQAMADLGYHPNVTARGLRSRRTGTFAFLVLDEAPSFLADPLTDLLIAGVADVARDSDYEILLKAERPLATERRMLRPLLEGRVDGAFALLSGEPALRYGYVDQLKTLDMPFVVFDEVIEDSDVLVVRTDERVTARQLTEHLIARGHEAIGFVAARLPWPVIEQRHLGYRDALAAAGLPERPELEVFDATWQASGGEAMAERLLSASTRPTAIICGSDVLAIGAIHAVKTAGLRVPDDVAVAGFDDFEFSRFADPPLTTVRVAAYEMGRIAADMLVRALAGEQLDAPHAVLTNELIVRNST